MTHRAVGLVHAPSCPACKLAVKPTRRKRPCAATIYENLAANIWMTVAFASIDCSQNDIASHVSRSSSSISPCMPSGNVTFLSTNIDAVTKKFEIAKILVRFTRLQITGFNDRTVRWGMA